MFGIKDLGPVTPLEETPSSAQHGVRSDKTSLLSKGRLTQESTAAAVVAAVAA